LETIGYFLRERGFSADVIKKMSRPQRESTIASYDSKWSVFRDWCGKDEFYPVSPTLPQFLDFLNFLFSVKGYRSTISTTLLLTRNMTLERPRTHHSSPKWDLSVVLRALMGFPFEPMDKVNLKYLTFKTVFLLGGNPRIHPRIPGEDPGG
jgi:hypothetical protein